VDFVAQEILGKISAVTRDGGETAKFTAITFQCPLDTSLHARPGFARWKAFSGYDTRPIVGESSLAEPNNSGAVLSDISTRVTTETAPAQPVFLSNSMFLSSRLVYGERCNQSQRSFICRAKDTSTGVFTSWSLATIVSGP